MIRIPNSLNTLGLYNVKFCGVFPTSFFYFKFQGFSLFAITERDKKFTKLTNFCIFIWFITPVKNYTSNACVIV